MELHLSFAFMHSFNKTEAAIMDIMIPFTCSHITV